MEYQYEPLSDPRAEIRVADLQPGAYDDEIRISFQTKQLKAEKSASTSVSPQQESTWKDLVAKC
jgi:hypothetical protein